jgi:hypothetical protein
MTEPCARPGCPHEADDHNGAECLAPMDPRAEITGLP